MGFLAEQYEPAEVARVARQLWSARGLPRPDGILGQSSAPVERQFEGAFGIGDDPGLVLFRAVAADVDARYASLARRRVSGILRREGDDSGEGIAALLSDLAVWTGGSGGRAFDPTERKAGASTILGRMAAAGVVVTRDAALRICASCGAPRSPERIIYQQEEGDTYLVRFPVALDSTTAQAIAWVDAPWRLLGATALLLNPDLPYVLAKYRRREVDETILTSRPSLGRLLEWLPGADIEVIDEGPGSRWAGRAYEYPLRHEFPMGGDLSPPAGTLVAVPDVGDSGTGIVPLVPGHGGSDAQIADRLGISGWPLVTARGQLDYSLMHKYAGLDLPTASEFVVRDLGESGALFARLRVRRGVPHCAICGSVLVWAPGRAWCLEPARLPEASREAYRRLLPGSPPISQIEVASWPVSEPATSTPGPITATLLECPRCERLAPPDASPQCECGASRNAVSRRLLPSIRAVLNAWSRLDPFPAGDPVRVYLNERRRAPALVHHLAAASGVPGAPTEFSLSILPGVPEGNLAELTAEFGPDALRAALVRGEQPDRTVAPLAARCAQERGRLARYWELARETLARCDPALLAAFVPSVTGFLAELEAEDRALLARWERTRIAVLADYDHGAVAPALRRLARFLEADLPEYFHLARPRLDLAGGAPSRRAALRTLHHVLRSYSVALAPVCPLTAEVVYGALVGGRTSVFEGGVEPLTSPLLDDERSKAWDRWGSVLRAVRRFRRSHALEPGSVIPVVVAVLPSEDLLQAYRADRPTLERLARVQKFEAYGPSAPWPGRQRILEPVPAEIQKVYPQEAGMIIHLLQRLPARRRPQPGSTDEQTVVIGGVTRRILPNMVRYTERLPARYVPAPWGPGELYVELGAGAPPDLRAPPPLSPDGFRLVLRLARQLRRWATDPVAGRPPIVVATLDPLAGELRAAAAPLAQYLGVPEVRVIDSARAFPLSECLFGRTRTGVRWWVHLPGYVRRRAAEKVRGRSSTRTRVRPVRVGPLPGSEESFDFLDPTLIATEEGVRGLVAELDGLLGAPYLGPSKIAGAWQAGLRSVQDFSNASLDEVVALPGFGRAITESLARKLGRDLPAIWLQAPPRALPFLDRGPVAPPPGNGGGRQNVAIPPPPPIRAEPGGSNVPFDSPPRPGDLAPAVSLPKSFSAVSTVTRLAVDAISHPATEPPELEAPAPEATDRSSSPSPAPLPEPLDASEMPPAPSPEIPASEVPLVDETRFPVHLPEATPESETSGVTDALPDAADPSTSPPTLDALPPAATGAPGSEAFDLPGPAPDPTPSYETAPEPVGDDHVAEGAEEPGRPPPDAATEPTPPEAPLEEMPRALDLSATSAGPEAPSIEPSSQVPSSEPVPQLTPEPAPAVPDSTATELSQEVVGLPLPDATHPSVQPVPPPLEAQPAPAPEPPLPPPPPEMPATPSSTPPEPDRPELSVPSEIPTPGAPPRGTPHPEEPVTAPPVVSAELATAPAIGEPSSVDDPTVAVAPEGPDESTALDSETLVPGPVGEVPAPPPEAPLPAPEAPPAPASPPPSPSGVELTVSPSYMAVLIEFLDWTAGGHRGVAVVRESPERLRAHVGPRPVEIYWLTNIGRGLTLKPTDLDGYRAFLQRAMTNERVTAVFLEGIEYLSRLHGTDRVVEALRALDADARSAEARIWVYVHPDLIASSDLERLQAAFALPTSG